MKILLRGSFLLLCAVGREFKIGCMKSYSHNYLVKKAASWVKKHDCNMLVPNCSIVASELVALTKTGEIPDVLGFSSFASVMVEVKTSRSDFLADFKKPFRRFPEDGVGAYKIYACEPEVIKESDVPEKWGLLYFTGRKFELVKTPEIQEYNFQSEKIILLSMIRRLKNSCICNKKLM